jgi:hypothetical protein
MPLDQDEIDRLLGFDVETGNLPDQVTAKPNPPFGPPEETEWIDSISSRFGSKFAVGDVVTIDNEAFTITRVRAYLKPNQ